jgi:D-alanyl-D-alanine carboxypeptidase (penicillin-binding protein 5/6)
LLTLSIGADGMKTGFTEDGGYGLVGSALQNGLRLIVVVNGAKSAKERADEAKRLLDWGFHGFEARPLFAEGQIVGEAKVFGGERGRLPLVAPGAVSILVPRNSGDRIVAKIVYRGPVPAPVQQGQEIATLRVFRGDTVALEVPLQANQSVARGNLPQRAMDAASELVINLLRVGISRI